MAVSALSPRAARVAQRPLTLGLQVCMHVWKEDRQLRGARPVGHKHRQATRVQHPCRGAVCMGSTAARRDMIWSRVLAKGLEFHPHKDCFQYWSVSLDYTICPASTPSPIRKAEGQNHVTVTR